MNSGLGRKKEEEKGKEKKISLSHEDFLLVDEFEGFRNRHFDSEVEPHVDKDPRHVGPVMQRVRKKKKTPRESDKPTQMDASAPHEITPHRL